MIIELHGKLKRMQSYTHKGGWVKRQSVIYPGVKEEGAIKTASCDEGESMKKQTPVAIAQEGGIVALML